MGANIVVDGRNIAYELAELDIFTIDYYTENPRINYIISKYPADTITSELIEKTLLRKESTKELIHEIEENGGLLEPVIVLSGKVIEGNTRLCAYRRLYQKSQQEKWRKIRAQVITEQLTQKEIFTILSNYHIRGKTPWDLYEKAACINKMIDQGQGIEEVARIIRSTKTKVENMLKAYKIMRDKYLVRAQNQEENGSSEDLKKFSYFDALFTNKDLAQRVENTPQFLDEFVEWVAEGRILKAQDVRELHNILNNNKAKKKFLEAEAEGCFEEAKEVLYWNKPQKINGFYKQIEQFRDLIRESNIAKIHYEINANTNMKHVIKMCLKDFKKFCKEIKLEDN